LATSLQIVERDGSVSSPLAFDQLNERLAMGKVLPSDQLRGEAGVVAACDVPELTTGIGSLSKSLTDGNVAHLISMILEIAGAQSAGRLIVTHRNVWRALVFCDGQLTQLALATDDKASRGAAAREAAEHAIDVFKWPSMKLGFIADDDVRAQANSCRFTARSVIDIGLNIICPDEVLREQALKFGTVRKGADALNMPMPPFDRTDWQLMESLDGVELTTRSVSAVASRVGLAESDVFLRLSLLKMAGYLASGKAKSTRPKRAMTEGLKTAIAGLRDQNFYERLGVRRGATPDDVAAAYETRRAELKAEPQDSDDTSAKRIRSSVDVLLIEARDTLVDQVHRAAYNKAQQSGLDYSDSAVRSQLLREMYLSHGRTLVKNRDYEQAVGILAKAIDLAPREAEAHILYGWAQFLASDESVEAAETAVAAVRRALDFAKDSDHAYLVIGKIYRLVGNRDAARTHLNKATQINAENGEAWAQLRLLNSQKDTTGALKLQLDLGQGMGTILLVALLFIGIVYACANLIPGGANEWPMVGEGAQINSSRMSAAETELTLRVQERLRGKIDYAIPKEKRVVGNVESFYLVEDAWFWLRRILLLIFGLVGITFISKENLSDIPIMGERSGLVFLALPYGLVVGFLSPLPMTPTELGPVLGMTAFHVIAEQIFFFAFVGRALLKDAENPFFSVFLTAVLFGLHQMTYFIVLEAPTSVMLTGVAQMTAFAGGAYALLLWRSGGILAPMIAHLLINMVMMTRSVTMYAA
jgi:tetratricopeptide (TPR) repeat protein